MPEMLSSVVQKKSGLDARYLAAAAPESMDAYLKDWREAHRRLGRQIEALESAHLHRLTQKSKGEWPSGDEETDG